MGGFWHLNHVNRRRSTAEFSSSAYQMSSQMNDFVWQISTFDEEKQIFGLAPYFASSRERGGPYCSSLLLPMCCKKTQKAKNAEPRTDMPFLGATLQLCCEAASAMWTFKKNRAKLALLFGPPARFHRSALKGQKMCGLANFYRRPAQLRGRRSISANSSSPPPPPSSSSYFQHLSKITHNSGFI